MASSKPSHSAGSSARSRHSARIMTQTTIDARLHADFEESGPQFDYSKSINRTLEIVSSNKVTAYLQQIQRGKLLQPFGCMLAVDEKTFSVIAYSENAPEMLTVAPHAVPTVGEQDALGIGTDATTIFTPSSAAALQKAAAFAEVNLLNPILVHCKNSGKPFYAILHRVDMGLVIDFEPVRASDAAMTAAGALQSYKLAAKAISRLQSLPSGDIGLLCDMVVQEVRELTGYDRVMAYKFHDDDHGEVISEIRKSSLEPYLGLHYPATDIPQASRFLFMKNRVRMICDCCAPPVSVVEDKRLPRELNLCGSTLRAPHGCHAQYMSNMGSIASLAMAVIINEKEEEEGDSEGQQQQKGRRLWGLIVCHHASPRFVPFPLRYACEFLMQVFGIQLNKEVELAAQLREKHILRTQTLLCDMLLRDAPVGIVTQKPNITDLVRCDGAALYYGKNIWLLGTTPTEAQILDIVDWISEYHMDSTGLSTDSLAEAGYPGAALLADAVCGMAAVRITSKDFLFWFRSHTAKEIKWGGAKHDASDKDDGRKMHPRSSFKAFLEVVKRRSIPWEDVEMDAIHSLQLILRGSFKDIDDNDAKTMIHTQLNDLRIQGMDELNAVTKEMVRLIETATAPILAVDAFGLVNGWNTKVAELTGLSAEEVLGEPLVNLVEANSVETVKRMLCLALQGQEEKNIEIKLKRHGTQEEKGSVILIVNACSSRDPKNNVVGVCFVAQDVTTQLDAVLKCEMWMLSRAKSYLEDQLLGFALVPLSSVVGKGKLTQDFALSSTDLFHSPAGTVRLTLQYRGSSSSDCHGNSFASTNLALSPASISSEVVLLDRSSEDLRPTDYGSIEFPDMEIARENEQLVSEYFKMASDEKEMENDSKREFQVADQTGFSGVTFLHLGATPIAEDDYDMSLNAEEEKHADPLSLTQETNLFAYRNPTDGENSSHTGILSSTTTSLSEEHNFLDFGEQKSSSVGESSHSHGSSPATVPTFESSSETPTSANGNVSGDNQRTLSSEEDTDKEGTGSSTETRMTERSSEPIFTKPLMSINLEPDQTVVQQQIVDMYMKSMQQFTESLAKMKLPMDIETNGSDDTTDTTSKQKKIETGKKEGARVYYGSRAFF